MVQPLWKRAWWFLKKLKNRITTGYSNFTCGDIYLPKEQKSGSQSDASTPMFIAALFTITKTWKRGKCPSTGEWMSKVWYIDTVENHSSLKRNNILTYATIQVNHQDVSWVKQASHQRTILPFHLYEIPRAVRTQRQKAEWWFPGAAGGGITV